MHVQGNGVNLETRSLRFARPIEVCTARAFELLARHAIERHRQRTARGDEKDFLRREQIALRDVRAVVAKFSLEIAEKIMQKNLVDDKAQQDLAKGFIKDLKLN